MAEQVRLILVVLVGGVAMDKYCAGFAHFVQFELAKEQAPQMAEHLEHSPIAFCVALGGNFFQASYSGRYVVISCVSSSKNPSFIHPKSQTPKV